MAERVPPMAVCPDDGEPLVMTFEFRGKEFVCVVCERLYEFLEPRAAVPTPELDARHAELQTKYDADRQARVDASVARIAKQARRG